MVLQKKEGLNRKMTLVKQTRQRKILTVIGGGYKYGTVLDGRGRILV